MDDTPEVPDTPPPPVTQPAPPPRKKWRRKVWMLILAIVLVPIVIFSLWAWVTLGYVYSAGDRPGYVQKLSKKGWLCKTWEGELNMAQPGAAPPQIFSFTIPEDSVANALAQHLGKRVTLTYEEHRGIPTNCFGDTDYFVTSFRILEP
jgi:hypothetical protein